MADNPPDPLPFANFAGSVPEAFASKPRTLQSAVQAWALTRAEESRRLLFALLSLHNSVAPICLRLPTEILTTIFVLHAGEGDPMVVAHVCRSWRAVALGTPRLWA
ncbi:uncharacterized protein BXZ73DRAFT_60773, partial [Epithele typhae]|uniref:uncharacterized protein n=1 Tax=Epithele typhae TaxID=378194 RepID=UPI002008086B